MLKNLFRRNISVRDRAQQVVKLTARAEPDPGKLWNELQALCQAGMTATPTEREEALQLLRTALSHSHPQVSGMVAISGGALVEAGTPAAPWAEALLVRVPAVLSAANRFVSVASARMGPAPEDESEDEEEWDEGAIFLDNRVVPPALVEELHQSDLEAVSAYKSLEFWGPPLVTCLSLAEKQRHTAASDTAFRETLENLRIHHEGMEMVYRLLEVLDNEPLLVLHPESGKGFSCRISGIGVNFELHMLLMEVLCSPAYGMPGKKLAPNAARVVWGRSDEEVPEGCVGNWNLYDWRAAGSDLSHPDMVDSNASLWIWNEGTPADIPLFEDYRVVLLGKPSYERGWNVGRLFSQLKPQFTVERTLSPTEVQSFLTRMASTAERLG